MSAQTDAADRGSMARMRRPRLQFRVEPKCRQFSLLAVFGYMTLGCVSVAIVRQALMVEELCFQPDLILVYLVVMCAANGAALGSLFGRPGAGAACGFVVGLIAFWVFASWVIVIET
jgi:hypothetical protein